MSREKDSLQTALRVQNTLAECSNFVQLERRAFGDLLRYFEADAAVVFTSGSRVGAASNSVMLRADTGVDLETSELYVQSYHSVDPILRFAQTLAKRPQKLKKPSVFRLTDTCDRRDLENTEYYKEFLGTTGVQDILVVSVPIDASGDEFVLMAFHRSEVRPLFSHQDVTRAKLIAPVIGGSIVRMALAEHVYAQHAALDLITSGDHSLSAMLVLDHRLDVLERFGLEFDDREVALQEIRRHCNLLGHSNHTQITEYENYKVAIRGEATDLDIERRLLGPNGVFYLVTAQQRNVKPADSLLHSYSLSERELQVASEVLDGRRNAEISKSLGISSKTVENHLTAIFSKTAVSNRTELVSLILGKR